MSKTTSDVRDIVTTNGEIFTYRQSLLMLGLIHVRFGRNVNETAKAWARMMQSTVSIRDIARMLDDYRTVRESRTNNSKV